MGFPGKNTDMCCHFLLQGIFPTQGSSLNIGVGCHALLHGIFPTQGTLVFPAWQVWILCHLGSSLLHWQMNSLPPNHLGNPSLLAICPQEKIMLLNLCGWGGLKTILKAAFLFFFFKLLFFGFFIHPLPPAPSQDINKLGNFDQP